ncbi:hypothetical protein BGZ70_004891 [Mortierella alpina]|uniref:Uncharacterized protein n=1 Tax=Mortierella alpina TaxID=64518 RepID=A0A9P6LVA9_MORAP|nr:hypothetical protein BGZ70_004891 [Mortierella alpina]
MLIKQIVIVGLVAVVATAQNIAWKGFAPICTPQSCETESLGARPIELRRSKCGDGNCCISGHKKCCADVDNEANRIACLFSDNGRKNPESDPDDDDYFQIIADLRRNREEVFRW